VAAGKRYDSLARDADATRPRLEELEALVEDTDGLEAGQEAELREERERIRHVAELGGGAAAAAQAIEPDDGEGAATLLAGAERDLAPIERIAPELAAAAGELRELVVRVREVGSDLRRFIAGLEADPERLEEIEERLQRWADLRRRYQCETAGELIERRDAARAELDELERGRDPVEAARAAVAEAEARCEAVAGELHDARQAAESEFSASISRDLHDVGMGEGEFCVELRPRALGATGRDEVSFLVRPNAGLPLAPVAETASGGELSRIALAIAAAGGGETMVFDEIDAGIGGVTAHKVAALLRRLAERAQVLTITHLPQIASVADGHFRVEKVPGDPTHARIDALDDDGRGDELERMLGGEEFLAAVARTGETQ
jgi:DNA repair protein RecN (Recombination protein N)